MASSLKKLFYATMSYVDRIMTSVNWNQFAVGFRDTVEGVERFELGEDEIENSQYWNGTKDVVIGVEDVAHGVEEIMESAENKN